MSRYVSIHSPGRTDPLLERVRWCESILCKAVGLMFRTKIRAVDSLLLVMRAKDAPSAGIHMFFVFFPLGVIWLTQEGKVVDLVEAKPWRVYIPKEKAEYILEAPPSILDRVSVGDTLEIRTQETM